MICKVCGKISVGNRQCLFCGVQHNNKSGISANVTDGKAQEDCARPLFCTNCGGEIKDGEKFCMNCGAAAPVRSGGTGNQAQVKSSGQSISTYDEFETQYKAREQAEQREKKIRANKRLSIAALVCGILLLLGGLASIVGALTHLKQYLIAVEETGEFYGRTFVDDSYAGAFIAYAFGACFFIPAFVMSLVAAVRARRNEYSSFKLSTAALMITILGTGVALAGGLGDLFNQLDWDYDLVIVTEDVYSYNRLLDEDSDKLSGYIDEHYKTVLTDGKQAENVKTFVVFKYNGDYGSYGILTKSINIFDYRYYDYEKISLAEIGMLYTVRESDKSYITFSTVKFSDAGISASDILNGRYDRSIEYTKDTSAVFGFDEDLNKTNTSFIDKLGAYFNYTDDYVKVFDNIKVISNEHYILVDVCGITKSNSNSYNDKGYNIEVKTAAFGLESYTTLYLNKYYQSYEDANYDVWKEEFENSSYASSWHDFDDYYRRYLSTYKNKYYDLIYKQLTASDTDHVYDYEILSDMIDKRNSSNRYVMLYNDVIATNFGQLIWL